MADTRDEELQGKWDQLTGRIREAWGALSDDDVQRNQGKWEQLVGTIKERTGESIPEIEKKLDELLAESEEQT